MFFSCFIETGQEHFFGTVVIERRLVAVTVKSDESGRAGVVIVF